MLWEAAYKHQFGPRFSIYDACIVKKFQRKNNIRFHTTWSGAVGADKILSARIQKYEKKKKRDNEEYVVGFVCLQRSSYTDLSHFR